MGATHVHLRAAGVDQNPIDLDGNKVGIRLVTWNAGIGDDFGLNDLAGVR